MAINLNEDELFERKDVRETSDVAITKGVNYYSFNGVKFKANNNVVGSFQEVAFNDNAIVANENGVIVCCSIELPHNAVISEVICYGNISDETWTLQRITNSTGAASTMATGNLNSADSTITNATVDNSTYNYWIFTSSLDTTDAVYGGRITYSFT